MSIGGMIFLFVVCLVCFLVVGFLFLVSKDKAPFAVRLLFLFFAFAFYIPTMWLGLALKFGVGSFFWGSLQ